jgi:hypothetical protein
MWMMLTDPAASGFVCTNAGARPAATPPAVLEKPAQLYLFCACILNTMQAADRASRRRRSVMLEASDVERWTAEDEELRAEPLIHLCEWLRQRGLSTPFPVPCVITAALWRRLERIPFRIVASTSFEDRVNHLIARARACLAAHTRDAAPARSSDVTLVFSASLPCRAEDPARQILHLQHGEVEGFGPAITLGLPEDLPLRGAAQRTRAARA